MPETRVFNESVLHNYVNLQNFFNRSPAIQEVLSKKEETYSGIPIPINANLDCKWQACQMATTPFRWILAVFLKAVAAGLDCCNATQLAKDMKNWSVHMIIGYDAFSQETTKVLKITSSMNQPNQAGKIVNEHPSIPESRVATSVREQTFCSLYKKIKFGHYQGICRGESFWFLYMYLKTKDQFSDPRAHMAALGEQFKDGGGMDPTLLQSISLNTGELLNLKIGTQSAAETTCRKLITYTPSQWRSLSADIIRQIKGLPEGAYAVGLPLHQTACIKIDNELGFFFDPNHGVIEIQGPEFAEKLYERITDSLEGTGDGSTKFPSLNLKVDFEPVTLRP
jgi:hypothetical protein